MCRIFPCLCQHIFRIIYSSDFISQSGKQNGEEPRTTSHIQHMPADSSIQCPSDLLFPQENAMLVLQFFSVA